MAHHCFRTPERMSGCVSPSTWQGRGGGLKNNCHVTATWFIAILNYVYRAPSGDPIGAPYEQKLKSTRTFFWTPLSLSVDLSHLRSIALYLVLVAHTTGFGFEGPSHAEQLSSWGKWSFPSWTMLSKGLNIEKVLHYTKLRVEWNHLHLISEWFLALS